MSVALRPTLRQEIWAAETARRECLQAIDDRFGWLKRLVAEHWGNVEDLKPHERQLWYVRESIVASYNRIGGISVHGRREAAYRRLTLEIKGRLR